jgi:hypothetical protein
MAPLDNTPTTPAAQLSVSEEEMVTKSFDQNDHAYELWSEVAKNAMNRLIERAARVISEKASGQKFRKAYFSEESCMEDIVETIFDVNVWTKQLYDDLLPVAKGAIKDGDPDFDSEIKSIRGISLINHINDSVQELLAGELANTKPDMNSLPSKIRSAIECISGDDFIDKESRKFAKYYVDLGSENSDHIK